MLKVKVPWSEGALQVQCVDLSNKIGREMFLRSRVDPPVFCLCSGPNTFNGLCVRTARPPTANKPAQPLSLYESICVIYIINTFSLNNNDKYNPSGRGSSAP